MLAPTTVDQVLKARCMEQAAFYYPAIKTIPVPQPMIRGAEAPATLPGT
jgi:hypothetical protein